MERDLLKKRLIDSVCANDLGEFVAIVRTVGDPNADLGAGRRPIHIAAEKDRVDMLRFLVENGAAVDAENSAGSTALKIAVYYGHHKSAEYLLSAGADPQKDAGASAIDQAEIRKDYRMLEMLRRGSVSSTKLHGN